MDFLSKVNSEADYDIVIQMVTEKSDLETVRTLFPGYNAKVLMSSFMIKNFSSDIFNVDPGLLQSATNISEYLINLQHEKLNKEYSTYFNKFTEWRKNDIDDLKSQIELKRDIYQHVVENDPKNSADEEWNEGVAMSISDMETKLDDLDKFANANVPT